MMDRQFEQWIKERDEVAYSFDVERFKKFYKKWAKRGVYENNILPSDEVIEITMRKMVCAMRNPKSDKLAEAKTWLIERGYKTGL